MAREAADPYGSGGSVPDQQRFEGAGATNQVRANASEFGGQIGEAVEKTGEQGQQVANQWAGLVAETQANQSILGYLKDQGDLKAKYTQYEGLQAEAMRPQYEAESTALQEKYRDALSPVASRMYDGPTRRSLANDINFYSGYAAEQVKKQNMNTFKALDANTIAKTGDINHILNDENVGSDMGDLTHNHNAVTEINGLAFGATGQDTATGLKTFPDTPEGKQLATAYQQGLDVNKANYFLSAAKTISETPGYGPTAAADWVQKHYSMIPDLGKSEINKFLEPKMINQAISGSIASADLKLDQGWVQNQTANVPSGPPKVGEQTQGPTDVSAIKNAIFKQESGGNGGAPGSANGAVGGMQILPATFAQYAKPGEDINNPSDNKAVGDRIVDDLAKKYNGDPARIAVGYFSGPGNVAPVGSPTPWLRDTTDANGKSVSSYVADVQAKVGAQPGSQPQYANYRDYLKANEADYMKGVTEDIAGKGLDYYHQQMAITRAQNDYTHKIQVADRALQADKDTVQNAIDGAYTKGAPVITQDQLKSIPGMQDVLDRVQREQGDFYQSIDVSMAKAAHRDVVHNTGNGYDAILGVLDTSNPNITRSGKLNYLAKGLGTTDPGVSISYKDYNDAKAAVDIDPTIQSALHDKMMQIATANGNVDGQGQARAINWYQQKMNAWKQNQAAGDSALKPEDFIKNNIEAVEGPHMPSRMQQLENYVKNMFTSKPQAAAQVSAAPPEAIAYLKAHPDTAETFRQHFGDPQQYLGQ